MATALAHIRVRAGQEASFERLAVDLYGATHREESAVRRYEYSRGTEPGTYYCLLSFDDFHGFLAHQSSDHHEAASPELGEVIESMRIEWLDPIQGASPLVPTADQPLPAGASAAAIRHHERFAGIGEDWWLERRASRS